MTTPDRLADLKRLADLIRDRDLTQLNRASRAKAETEALIRALDYTSPAPGLDPTVLARVEGQFGLWTAERRLALNRQHARDTADWLNAKDEARRAFGRAHVLSKLLTRL